MSTTTPPPPTPMAVLRPRRLTLLGSICALGLNVMGSGNPRGLLGSSAPMMLDGCPDSVIVPKPVAGWPS